MRLHLSPILSLFLCTLSFAAPPATQPSEPMTIDKDKKSITIPAKIAPRKLDYLNDIYPIEVIACWPHPRGQKAHETVVTFDVMPSEVSKALESFGLKPGKQATETQGASGPELKIFLEIPDPAGGTKRIPIEQSMVDMKTGRPMPKLKWYYTSCAMKKPDPDKAELIYAADLRGTLVCVFPVTDEVVIQTNLLFNDQSLLKLETNKKLLPPEGTPVKIIIEAM
jgi:hypothetical protein